MELRKSHSAALVIGGGTMGAGIAQVLLQAGVRVTLAESSEEFAEAARERVVNGLRRAGDAYDGRESDLDVVVGFDEPIDVDIAIEAVPERPDLKRDVLSAVEKAIPAEALIVSNTSSLSITELAQALDAPERFLGMHFFNPVPKSVLVELVVGQASSAEAVEIGKAWVELLGKEQIEVKDSPGFATSRLGLVIGLEAIRMVQEGVASAADIDKGMELGYRFPMGPLRLTDLVGLDVRLAIAEHLAETLGSRFDPPQLLRDKVAAGELGKKSGKGFFQW